MFPVGSQDDDPDAIVRRRAIETFVEFAQQRWMLRVAGIGSVETYDRYTVVFCVLNELHGDS